MTKCEWCEKDIKGKPVKPDPIRYGDKNFCSTSCETEYTAEVDEASSDPYDY